jgi:hypothetical protein
VTARHGGAGGRRTAADLAALRLSRDGGARPRRRGRRCWRAPRGRYLLTDDGLQHYALQRDVEIILFDGRGAGNGWLLPAGRCASR